MGEAEAGPPIPTGPRIVDRGELVDDPLPTTPARRPRSIRRTSHVDMGIHPDRLDLDGEARDLRTDDAGHASVVGSATVAASLGEGHALTMLEVDPARRALDDLVGLPVAGGFRAAVDAAIPDDRAAATPLYLLMDELPVAALISGYALLYTGNIGRDDSAAAMKSDICAGWRHDGTMMVELRAGNGVPLPVGPATTVLEPDDDPDAWHAIGPLPAGSMRRRRLVEVAPAPGDPGKGLVFWAMFRDTHLDTGDDAVETVLHEYSLSGAIGEDGVITSCVATPQVLPWTECPEAVASAGRLVGLRPDEVRDTVRREFRGITTCTHLNDLLRSLGDLDALAHLLVAAP